MVAGELQNVPDRTDEIHHSDSRARAQRRKGRSGGLGLRLRGLPHDVVHNDVLAFFAVHDVADRIADGRDCVHLFFDKNNRPVQATVNMRSLRDARVAQRVLNFERFYGEEIEVTFEPTDIR